MTSGSGGLNLLSNGGYGYAVASVATFGSLPNYYRIAVALKYSATSAVALTFSASTPSTNQTEVLSLQSASGLSSVLLTTAVVHSNNLKITPNTSFTLVEMWLRL